MFRRGRDLLNPRRKIDMLIHGPLTAAAIAGLAASCAFAPGSNHAWAWGGLAFLSTMVMSTCGIIFGVAVATWNDDY